jgi:uncharacterized membrane protein YfcA
MSAAAVAGYLAIGSVSGFFAGLLGIGGGIILVPALLLVLEATGFPAERMFQTALGTSMATILLTSLSSLRAHHARGAVRWPVVINFTPGVLLGTALGTLIARHVSTEGLTMFFACFVLFVALQMGLGFTPGPGRALPGRPGQILVASGIGVLSALVAIGGGAMTVPFLLWCNTPVREAIGTSAAVGFPIAFGGTLGYIINGWTVPGLPTGSLGFVYLPALVWTMIAAGLLAPLGARAAHHLPGRTLRRVFAVMLALIAAKMLYGLWA